MEESPSIYDLPKDVLTHVVSFLDTSFALRLTQLNTRFRNVLNLSTLHAPEPLIRQASWYGGQGETGNTPRRSVWIPVLLPRRTHSVVLTCNWRDQGWGNRKGGLLVVAVPFNEGFDTDRLSVIENGEIVCESPLAPHEQSSLRISFNYSPSKAYYLWYRVGGGGGHTLLVENLTAHAVIYDHAGKWLLRNYDALKDQGAVQNKSVFYLNLLRATAQSMREQLENNQNPDAHLASMLESSNIRSTVPSMKSLEELSTALLELKHLEDEQPSVIVPQARVGRVVLHRAG